MVHFDSACLNASSTTLFWPNYHRMRDNMAQTTHCLLFLKGPKLSIACSNHSWEFCSALGLKPWPPARNATSLPLSHAQLRTILRLTLLDNWWLNNHWVWRNRWWIQINLILHNPLCNTIKNWNRKRYHINFGNPKEVENYLTQL